MSSQYEERDAYELDKTGGYYTRHVTAMTKEGLHSKSDISAELAHRDREIDKLKAHIEHLRSAIRNTVAKWEGVTEVEPTLYTLMRFYNKTSEQCLAGVKVHSFGEGIEACIDAAIDLGYLENDAYQCAQLRQQAKAGE